MSNRNKKMSGTANMNVQNKPQRIDVTGDNQYR
jgi:hypothetical protein